jgi:hypothetical protein
MEQSVDMCGGLSQLVHVGIAVRVGKRFWMAEAAAVAIIAVAVVASRPWTTRPPVMSG